jgi:hypothetical protein
MSETALIQLGLVLFLFNKRIIQELGNLEGIMAAKHKIGRL